MIEKIAQITPSKMREIEDYLQVFLYITAVSAGDGRSSELIERMVTKWSVCLYN